MKMRLDRLNPDYQRLKKYQKIWKQKKILRQVYTSWYQKIIKDLKSGKTLELGSGTGNFKQFYPSAISSDIIPCEWLDKCIDAHHLPFSQSSLSNIVMIDALHHLQKPLAFLKQAHKTLKPGGRIILIEPFPSPFSLIAYKLFHPEPFIFTQDLFTPSSKDQTNKLPWQSNQAMAYLLFYRHLAKFNKAFKGKFKIIKKQKFSLLLYPLSGGFENRQIIPDWLFPVFIIIEKFLTPVKSLIAFRCYLVIEKIN